MKINGIKHLNSNWYDYILIRNVKLDDTCIDVKNTNKHKTIKSSKCFFDSIKKLNDRDKINEIIRYYLRNNKIHSLENNAILNYYDGNFIAIEGTRNLYLQLTDGTLDKEVLDEIKEKYIKDRYEYLFNNEFKRIEIRLFEDETSYNIFEDNTKYKEEILYINLIAKDKTLFPFEREFFDKYIKYIFDSTDSKINYYYEGLSVYYLRYYYDLKFGEYLGYILKVINF